MRDLLRQLGILERPAWLYLAIAGLALAFGWPLCQRAIILSDEGYLLQQALDLLQGRVLYRDMDAFITPGIWFTLAGVFAVFGPSVLASRVVILIVYVALALTGYRIVAPIAGRRWGLVSVACLLLFSVWAFPAWTFAFYSPVAVVLALAGIERLMRWQRRRAIADLAWMGAFIGLSICFKQNYGVFAAIAAGLGYAATRLEAKAWRGSAREIGVASLAAIAVGSPFLLYLIAQGALGDAWTSLVVHPFEFGGRHDIPYLGISTLWQADLFRTGAEKLTYLSFPVLNTAPVPLPGGRGLVIWLHALAYWLAPLIIFGGLLVAFASGRARGGRLDPALFTINAAAGLIFLGVFPRADFNHLVNVYQPLLIAGPLTLQRLFELLRGRADRLRRVLAIASAFTAILYGAIALYWYAGLIQRLSVPLEQPRAGVLVSPLEALEINYQVRLIRDHTPEGGALLTLPDLTMLNFLAEREVPSAWYNLYEHHIAKDRGQGVARAAEEKNVRYAVARFNNFFSDRVGLLEYAPDLADYLISNFERSFVGGRENYIVYTRRDEPAIQHPYIDLLANCDVEGPGEEIRKHLLFSALYHRERNGSPIGGEGIATRCLVQVPEEGGVLALEIGYRKPFQSNRGTRLDISIDLLDQDGRQPILEERLPVIPWQGSPRQQTFKRFEIDLGRWAGRTVTLEFSTYLQGKIQDSILDLKGFAMIYRDPRLQSKAGGARP